MLVPSEERLEVYQSKISKNSIKTQPRGLAEPLWGGPLALEAVSCGVPPMHCWATVNNTSGHLKTMPWGLAKPLWRGPLPPEAVSCGVPPMHCWEPERNTAGHQHFT